VKEEKSVTEFNYARRNIVLLTQTTLSAALLMIYLFSGVSRNLFRGLSASFGGLWGIINLLYIGVAVFGYYVFMFPVIYYKDCFIKNHDEPVIRTQGEWMRSYLRKLILDILLLSVLFNVVYLFLKVSPVYWWIYVTLCCVFFVLITGVVLPALFSQILSAGYAIPDRAQAHHILERVSKLGFRARGVQMWGEGEPPPGSPIFMAGLGRSRTILIESTALKRNTWEETDTLIAREIAHVNMNTRWKTLLLGTLLTVAGMYVAHLFLSLSTAGPEYFGIENISDVTTFPILVLSVELCAILTLPLFNYYRHSLEFRADDYAVITARSSKPLISAITRQNEQEMGNPDPAALVEIFLNRIPSVKRRVMRAKEVESKL